MESSEGSKKKRKKSGKDESLKPQNVHAVNDGVPPKSRSRLSPLLCICSVLILVVAVIFGFPPARTLKSEYVGRDRTRDVSSEAGNLPSVVKQSKRNYDRNSTVTPFNSPLMKQLEEISDASYKNAMLWGTYRPGLYFGLRTRKPRSLLVGLLWFDPDSPDTVFQQKLRFKAQESNNLDSYGWRRHDGRLFGEQIILDGPYNISVSFLKLFEDPSEIDKRLFCAASSSSSSDSAEMCASRNLDGPRASHPGDFVGVGGDWAARIAVTRNSRVSRDTPLPRRIALVLQVADEDAPTAPWVLMPSGNTFKPPKGHSTSARDDSGPSGRKEAAMQLLLTGRSSSLDHGRFSLWVRDSTEAVMSKSEGGKTSLNGRSSTLAHASVPRRPPKLSYAAVLTEDHQPMYRADELLIRMLNVASQDVQRKMQNLMMHGRREDTQDLEPLDLGLSNREFSPQPNLAFFQTTCELPCANDWIFFSHADGGGMASSSASASGSNDVEDNKKKWRANGGAEVMYGKKDFEECSREVLDGGAASSESTAVSNEPPNAAAAVASKSLVAQLTRRGLSPREALSVAAAEPRVKKITGSQLSTLMKIYECQFDRRVTQVFGSLVTDDDDSTAVDDSSTSQGGKTGKQGKGATAPKTKTGSGSAKTKSKGRDGVSSSSSRGETKASFMSVSGAKGSRSSPTVEVATAALSNMLGGMVYMYGETVLHDPTPPETLGEDQKDQGTFGTTGREGVTQNKKPPRTLSYWKAPLFTAVPSRSFFPRGFLWDEGFHQLLIQKWDPEISRDILAHWLDLINADGWIPREQVLGLEAKMRVPAEFLVQNSSHANAPSLLLPISRMIDKVDELRAEVHRVRRGGNDGSSGASAAAAAAAVDDIIVPQDRALLLEEGLEHLEAELEHLEAFLLRAWPRLRHWVGWFLESQSADGHEADNNNQKRKNKGGKSPVSSSSSPPPSFRWLGREPVPSLSPEQMHALKLGVLDVKQELNPKTLPSGLDDYPRASHPDAQERHLDLRCWLSMAASVMGRLARIANDPVAAAEYEDLRKSLTDLDALRAQHQDPVQGSFHDWGLHSENVNFKTIPSRSGPKYIRVTGATPKYQFVPAFGYVSLFPLFMEQLRPTPLSPEAVSDPAKAAAALKSARADKKSLAWQLDLLRNPALLWSPHGLRSLSPTSSFYMRSNTHEDKPYWRGQIWMNMNFLALRSLDRYRRWNGTAEAPLADEIYRELRANVLRTIVRQYGKQGYIFEQYSDVTGQGMGSHPFTGWSALVTLIASERY